MLKATMDGVPFSALSPEQQQDFLNGPSMKAPEGITSNLIDPPNHNGMAIAASVTCVAVVLICVSLRAYSRLVVAKKVMLEDCMMSCKPISFFFSTWLTASKQISASLRLYVHHPVSLGRPYDCVSHVTVS